MTGSSALITVARQALHAELAQKTLLLDGSGVPTNADSSNKLSIGIAQELCRRVPHGTIAKRPSGQTLGIQMERAVLAFVKATFLPLKHLRPGTWTVASTRNISEFDQYFHLKALEDVLRKHPSLRTSLGGDYVIKPDVVVARDPEDDASINSYGPVVDSMSAKLTPLRKSNSKNPRALLHASISCKWTFRSDRAQNSRSEALNLIRNRKGHLPHVVVVTAEPLPNRLASLCLGTGDLDCVYHTSLNELVDACKAFGDIGSQEMLGEMIEGKRLKDISDLPLDLAG